jgi:hypothetical protein
MKNKLTKKEAIKRLIIDYENKLIASNFTNLDDLDIAMCKALKISIKNKKE